MRMDVVMRIKNTTIDSSAQKKFPEYFQKDVININNSPVNGIARRLMEYTIMG